MRGQELTAWELALLLALSGLSLLGAWALDRNRLPGVKLPKERSPREPPLWGAREVVLVLIFWIAAKVFFGVAFSIVADSGPLIEALQFCGIEIAAAAATLWAVSAVVRGTGQLPEVLGFRSPSGREIAAAIVLWAVLFFPFRLVHLAWLEVLMTLGAEPEAQPLVESFRQVVSRGAWAAAVGYALPGAIVAPVVEETLFRGLLYGTLRRSVSPVGAAVVTSALFGAVHLSLSASVTIFALSLVLCYLYERTGSLYPAVAFHAVFNTATYVFLALGG